MTSRAEVATWPAWTRLRLEHKPLLDSLASPDPYCDWTFATLWSWDTEEAVALSRLGDGFALRLPSYPLGGPEDFSLNGRPNADEIDAFVREHREVSLVPRTVLKGLALTGCQVEDDRDQYDYAYDVVDSLEMAGGRYEAVRGALRKAMKCNPDAVPGELDMSDRGVSAEVLGLFDDWAGAHKADSSLERRALVRCVELARVADLRCAAVSGHDGLLGFSILAPQLRGWTVTPFAKTRPGYTHLARLLWRATLELSDASDFRWINQEQDLGIPGLRQHKMSLRPARLLEKVRLVAVAAE